CLQGYRSPFSF
nr:immunoglobulin light chain junction region [Macaca mulatta]MOX98252.1 immunoglobulin light chain junction region [Macaca mulatta]MOX98406.1 immunoglobulin light chain junction region [Macaca mulatta]MOX98895.1 immunoglobulin light chain junction region [Macaca mulatta]MOY00211.1 immunoglobulin light chain junction region [Macaca mulatta]